MKLARDWSLMARMLLVFGVLAALYAVFAGVLAIYLGNIVGVVVLFGLLLFGQLFWGHRMALRSIGARTVDSDEHPELHRRVERLSKQAGMRKPDVAVSGMRVPNAFATGRSNKTAVVCVTEGLLETLDDDELDAVIAHELAHIKNRDFVVMTLASTIATVAFMIIRWGYLFAGGNNRGGGGRILIVLLAAALIYVLSFIAMRFLSRYREYAADRGAAQITGKPMALASALQKITGKMDNIPKKDLRDAEGANALYIQSVSGDALTSLLRTHPKVENRVEHLQEIAAEFEQA